MTGLSLVTQGCMSDSRILQEETFAAAKYSLKTRFIIFDFCFN